MALQQGVGDILYAASARGPTVYTTFITTRDAIKRHRAALVAMTRAMRRMQHWLSEHSADELAALVAPFFADIPRDLLATALARYREAGIWSRAPDISREGFDRLAASLLSGRFIAQRPSYDDCVEQSLA
jgi:NitT/TauT family transport system substrate-binding protein